jgi:TPR repeat protein
MRNLPATADIAPRRRLGPALAAAVLCAMLLPGCETTDPALQQAMSEVAAQPGSARVKLRPFAEQGNERAITQICIAYGRSMDSQVRGPERAEAFGWCRHAAAGGDADAEFHLGRFHAWGIGTVEDRAMALHWYTQAASHGHAEAEDAKRGLEGESAVCRNWITNCRMF